jgi:uncharacterized phage protein (TIGR02218 family)
MKSIPLEFKKHLKSELSQLATLWKIERKDGLVLGFTDHDRDIIYNSVIYQSSGGYTPSAIETQTGLNVDNLNVQSVIDHSSITEEDIRAGKYDNADVEILRINWKYPSDGAMFQRAGKLGELTTGRLAFEAEIRGMMQPLSQRVGRIYTAGCQANFCDSKCQLNEDDFSFIGEVTQVIDNRRFNSSLLKENGFFNGGILTFTSGKNNLIKTEVKISINSSGRLELYTAMIYDIQVGDTFKALRGCNKDFNTCKIIFNNEINFRGFPKIPGYDNIYKND